MSTSEADKGFVRQPKVVADFAENFGAKPLDLHDLAASDEAAHLKFVDVFEIVVQLLVTHSARRLVSRLLSRLFDAVSKVLQTDKERAVRLCRDPHVRPAFDAVLHGTVIGVEIVVLPLFFWGVAAYCVTLCCRDHKRFSTLLGRSDVFDVLLHGLEARGPLLRLHRIFLFRAELWTLRFCHVDLCPSIIALLAISVNM